MFQVNDHVMYGNQGICTVTDICRREINGENISYYVLQPVFDNKSTIFIPCKNAQLTGKKLHAADVKLLDTAQKLLHEELAFVLGISPEEVPEFIQKKTEEKNR